MTDNAIQHIPDDPSSRRALIAALRRQGIHDERVLAAIDRVPRAAFVDPDLRHLAWENAALAIPHGQTISQPYVVALMTQALQLSEGDRVLEIGTGSGYQAAILAQLAGEVVTIERIPELSDSAARLFRSLDIHNIVSILGDGSDGWAPSAPYDAIIVTAGARSVPAPLLDQLSGAGGRMIIPVGPPDDERLKLIRKEGEATTTTDLGGVRFVPLISNGIQEHDEWQSEPT
ncbi:MAG: protein-L-isoaspartate(D-aspartate) O-methyltransferase [Thermomicrobiales bacterium]|nr:protein-L-isoaspartate(D-aspartate) O-methyltransferase [Thermomicrobiales bacterium]MCO5223251.1 protein-L-isoaspartate(D-aspartate) O-methyltransferase [Thermomicrobiales bacterium]